MRTAFTDLVGVGHPIVGFNRSPGVVAEVTKAGGFGVLAASAYTPAELDAQLTWIEQQVGGGPTASTCSSRRSSPPATRPTSSPACARRSRDGAPRVRQRPARPGTASPRPRGRPTTTRSLPALNPDGALALLDVAFSHPIALIANALGTPPARPGRPGQAGRAWRWRRWSARPSTRGASSTRASTC